MGIAERKKLQEIVAKLRFARANARTTESRMPDETAQEYIEHYETLGWHHFTPEHCPPHLYPEVYAYRCRMLRMAA